MKTPRPSNCALLITLLVLGLTATPVPSQAGDTNAVQQASAQTTLTTHRPAAVTHSHPAEPRPYEIVGRRVSYSGVLVQAIKADNPLHLINPFAPEEYGDGHAHLVRDPITRKANGIALLRIRF